MSPAYAVIRPICSTTLAALHHGKRLARPEPELGIEAQRTVVVGRLDQPDARKIPRCEVVDHRLHEVAANALVLHHRIHRNRTDAGNWRALVGEVAADDPTLILCHHAAKTRIGK